MFWFWFCICCDLWNWFKKDTCNILQPIRSKGVVFLANQELADAAFSRACRGLRVYASVSDWFIASIVFDALGESYHFGFVRTVCS